MFVRTTHDNGSRVLPGQPAVRVNSPRNVASLSAKNEPKQLKKGPKEAPQVTEGDVDAAISGEVVSKGQFATLRNVSPGRVSQWISEGKIKPDALVGEGRKAKINVAVATRQFRDSLDIGPHGQQRRHEARSATAGAGT